MAGEALVGAIEALVAPALAQLGFDLEEVAVLTPPGRREIRIVVDRDGGADLDALAEVSRALESTLDDSDALGTAPYDLEVTTPGIGRPLTSPRHWLRNRGRAVTVEYSADGSDRKLAARIGDSDADGVTLVTADKGRLGTVQVPYAAIGRAVVDVDFTRPSEAVLRACGLDDAEIVRRRTPAS